MPKKNENNSNKDNKKKKSKKIKKSTIKKAVTIVVLIAILTVILYFAFKTLNPKPDLAEVNGEIITNQQLEEQYNQLPDQYKMFITKEDFLDQMINVKLLLQEAKKQEILVTEDEIEEELTIIKEQAETEEEFNDMLKQSNTNLEELKKQINDQLIINKLLDEIVISKIDIRDSQIEEYYEKNGEYFQENNIVYDEAKEQIEQMLLNDLSNTAIQIYINQLRSGAAIKKDGIEINPQDAEIISEDAEITSDIEVTQEDVEITEAIETFTQTDDEICKEDNKPIIRLFSTTTNTQSKWISQTFNEIANEYSDDIVAYHWQLNTGDNTLTSIEETGIPKAEVSIFQQYNSKNTVPTYVFGCKYIRTGNAHKTLVEEKEEFKKVIGELLV